MKRLLLFVLLVTPPWSAVADSWRPPSVETYSSRMGNYRLTVFPGGDAHASGPQRPCEATLEKLEGNAYRQLWRKPLRNEIAPVSALVSDTDGRFITFDNWASVGYGESVVVVYDDGGMPVRDYSLKALVGRERFKSFRRSVSSIWWGGKHQLSYDDVTVSLQVVSDSSAEGEDTRYEEIRLRLDTGELLKP